MQIPERRIGSHVAKCDALPAYKQPVCSQRQCPTIWLKREAELTSSKGISDNTFHGVKNVVSLHEFRCHSGARGIRYSEALLQLLWQCTYKRTSVHVVGREAVLTVTAPQTLQQRRIAEGGIQGAAQVFREELA
jgi:hypothetical protein